jgi:hypothetical protein
MPRIRNLPKNRASVYLSRARQYDRQLALAVDRGEWDAAGLSAVHLVIASVDAVTCAYLGKVWSGEDHAGVVDLLREAQLQGSDAVTRQVASVLEKKTRVEYGAEAVSAASSAELAKQAKRVFEWAVGSLRAAGFE